MVQVGLGPPASFRLSFSVVCPVGQGANFLVAGCPQGQGESYRAVKKPVNLAFVLQLWDRLTTEDFMMSKFWSL